MQMYTNQQQLHCFPVVHTLCGTLEARSYVPLHTVHPLLTPVSSRQCLKLTGLRFECRTKVILSRIH
jgi:hypothetical protein